MWHDDHSPPHIHVEYQGFEALVNIATGIVSAGELPRKVAAIVQEWCLVHQTELQNNWLLAQRFEPLVIKILNARYIGNFTLALQFSDGSSGCFNGVGYLKDRTGSLLQALKNEDYFKRFFIEAGALSWPNGLELSPQRLHELCALETAQLKF